MQYHDQPGRNRLVHNNNLIGVFINSVKHERTPFALLAGWWTLYMYTLTYATLTIGVTNRICDTIKKSKGLK